MNRKPKRKHGLQWDMDQEIRDQERKVINNFGSGGCGGGEGSTNTNTNTNTNTEEYSHLHPPFPPPSPSHLDLEEGELSTIVKEIMSISGTPACLYEHPATRETIRRKLQGLGVSNVNQLIRTHQAADLLEAISDFERARRNGLVIMSPTGYFRSLLE